MKIRQLYGLTSRLDGKTRLTMGITEIGGYRMKNVPIKVYFTKKEK